MEPWEYVAGILARQRNVIATWQAEAVGLNRAQLSAAVRRRGWERLHRGVIGAPSAPDPLRGLTAGVLALARPTGGALRVSVDAKASAEEYIEAVVAAAMEAGHAVSGRSGSCRHGFAPPPRRHELWLPWQSGRVTRPELRLRYGGPAAGEIHLLDGLPVLDAEACVIETARTPIGTFEQRVDEVVWQMARADSLRKLTIDSVEDRLSDVGSCCGIDVMEEALRRARGGFSHSRLEASGRDLVREVLEPLGLHVEDEPYAVRHEGRIIAEADVPVLEIRLDFEIDGPHHRFADQRAADAERDRLMRRVSWQVERLPEELIRKRPAVARARIRDAALLRMSELGRSPSQRPAPRSASSGPRAPS